MSMPDSPVKTSCCQAPPLPRLEPEPTSSCCGPKVSAPEPSSSSCCAPRVVEAGALAKPVAVAQGGGWKAYTPLLVIVGSVLLSTAALQLSVEAGQRSMMFAMSQFMGLFLIVFAMLKLFDLTGFVSGFARYDLLAGPVRPYGYVYPFLELGFGLALLARVAPLAVNGALAALMFFGAAGVLRSLRRGESLRCACMGSSLNVPLSTVAVVEDVGMGLMSLAMLVALS